MEEERDLYYTKLDKIHESLSIPSETTIENYLKVKNSILKRLNNSITNNNITPKSLNNVTQKISNKIIKLINIAKISKNKQRDININLNIINYLYDKYNTNDYKLQLQILYLYEEILNIITPTNHNVAMHLISKK